MHGKNLLKTYSRTQATIALSSAEAELYATVQDASEGLGLAAMALDFGKVMVPWLYVDASAAIGIAQRKGLGKIRHLHTQSLWVQDAVREKRVYLDKVPGVDNPADMCTKHLDAQSLLKHMKATGMQARGGRSEVAPDLVRSKDKNDTLKVGDVSIESLTLDVEEDEECEMVESEGPFPDQHGTPWLRGGSSSFRGREPEEPVRELSGVHDRRRGRRVGSEGFTLPVMKGEKVKAHGRLSVLRDDCECRVETIADKGCEMSPADRRRTSIECPSTRVLPESGTCAWQSRRDARHRFSALSAGGEVQKVAPLQCIDRQSECAFDCVSVYRSADDTNGTCKHCTCQSMQAPDHVRAQATVARSRVLPQQQSDFVAVGAQEH